MQNALPHPIRRGPGERGCAIIFGAPLQRFLRLFACLVEMQRLSRERAQLAEMDQAALKDIGMTVADCAAELRKPVWRR